MESPLLGVQLHNELLIQLDLHQFAPLRQGDDAALERFAVDVDPTGRGRMRGGIAGGQNGGMLLAAFADRDDVADLDRGRWDVALAAVDVDMAVVDNLAGLGAAGAEAHAVDDAVEAALQGGHQVVAGDALGQGALFEGAAELPFQNAVHAACLLFFAKLQAVAHNLLRAIFAMLAGNEVALFDGALFRVAAFAFQKQFHALAPALPANGTNVSCQVSFPFPSLRCGLRPMAGLLPAYYYSKCPRTKFILCASSADGSRCAEWA